MCSQALRFHGIGFTYGASDAPLFQDLSLTFPPGWTGIMGANGAGKTTLLKLASGELEPVSGTVEAAGAVSYLEQRTDTRPEGLMDLLASTHARACRTRGLLRLGEDWADRWDTLSHGERKRAQIAVALWAETAILAVDEPTNHIDRAGRELLLHALRLHKGPGLLVSHDRGLLDGLCRQCLFLDPPRAVLRPGGYTEALATIRKEEETAREEHRTARKTVKRISREVSRRREEASRSHQRRSKRGLTLRDHDARYKKNLARMSNKDGAAGKAMRQLEGRLGQAVSHLQGIRIHKDDRLGIWLEGSRSQRNRLLSLPSATLPLGDGRLVFPDLELGPDDRIALTGPNGAGKSTLLRHILPLLSVPEEHLTLLPQEIDRCASREVLDRLRGLPRRERGHALTVVARLGSVPERLLQSREPSPGEVRKLLLALGIARRPHLIVLDEPTNHLDLPSIECLEQALSGCPCALLLVSHDQRFLDSLTRKEWRIEESGHREYVLHRAERGKGN